MTASGRLPAYLALGGAGLLAALLFGRPEGVVLAAPFLLAAAVGLALARPPELDLELALDRERALEGEEVGLTVRVRARRRVARLEIELVTSRALRATRRAGRRPAGLAAGATAEERWLLACRRWGGRLPGVVRVRVRDPLGFFSHLVEERRLPPLRVYPRSEALRRLVRPADTQAFAGNELSRLRGDGIEFADIRPFVPGDRVRRVNWRVSARRGVLHVNEMVPERSADVVLFLDSFDDVRAAAGGTLDLGVRAAAGLARAWLSRRDRVGLVGFGGTLRWLVPGMGERQGYRILDALIDTEVSLSYAWKGLEVIPRRTLPPRSLVVALSPLLDERTVAALLDLRGRGHDVSVVEISPLPFTTPGRGETERLAYRIWELEREALRARFLAMGVPIATWRAGEPLQGALAAVDSFRGRGRAARP